MLSDIHDTVMHAMSPADALPTSALLEAIEGRFRRWELAVRFKLGIDRAD